MISEETSRFVVFALAFFLLWFLALYLVFSLAGISAPLDMIDSAVSAILQLAAVLAAMSLWLRYRGTWPKN